MNSVIQFFTKPLVQVIIIIILLTVIIWLVSENFSNVKDDAFNRRPPHIEELTHHQLVSQSTEGNEGTEGTDESNNAPNFGRKNQENTLDNTRMVPGNVYRMNTGRDAYQEEQFVSIYDANFGGMLGTNMGL